MVYGDGHKLEAPPLVRYSLDGYDELHMTHLVHLLQDTFFSDLARIMLLQ